MYTLGQLFSNKLLQVAGIGQLIASVADVQEIDILLRSDAKDIISAIRTLSADILYQQARKGLIYFTTLQLIFILPCENHCQKTYTLI